MVFANQLVFLQMTRTQAFYLPLEPPNFPSPNSMVGPTAFDGELASWRVGD